MDHDRTQLVINHLDLVDGIVSHVMRRLPDHVERDELIGCGRVGLLEAADRFDVDRGVPFRQFARRRVEGAVLDSLRAADWTPTRIRATLRQVNECESQLRHQLHRQPTEAEVARCAELTETGLRRLRQQSEAARVASIDAVDAHGSPRSEHLIDLSAAASDERHREQLLLQELRSAIARLPERHRLALTGTYLQGRPGIEIARLLGVSPSRVSQLRADAIRMLTNSLRGRTAGSVGSAERVTPCRPSTGPLARSAATR